SPKAAAAFKAGIAAKAAKKRIEIAAKARKRAPAGAVQGFALAGTPEHSMILRSMGVRVPPQVPGRARPEMITIPGPGGRPMVIPAAAFKKRRRRGALGVDFYGETLAPPSGLGWVN